MHMTTHRSGRKSLSFTRLQVTKLTVERLERRELMAGDVTAHVEGQMLIILGDDTDNGVVLTYDSTAHSYHVSGSDAGGSPTTINGVDTSQPGNDQTFINVQSVHVGLVGGNDHFEVGSPTAVDTVIAKWLAVEMGDGDDTVTLGVAGNAAGGSVPIARSLDTGTSVKVELGAGNDHLSMANAKIGLDLNVFGGDGDDHVDFDTEFTPTGASSPTLFPAQIQRNVLISLGGGADELTLKHTAVQNNLTILDGAGVATIDLFNVGVKKRIDINTAGDGDNIDLQLIRAKQMTINTNGGVDHVELNTVVLTTLNVKLGSERDHLRLVRTKTSLFAHLNGDGSGAVLSGFGNSLRGLWRRNFG
jgi:hypothetical protein